MLLISAEEETLSLTAPAAQRSGALRDAQENGCTSLRVPFPAALCRAAVDKLEQAMPADYLSTHSLADVLSLVSLALFLDAPSVEEVVCAHVADRLTGLVDASPDPATTIREAFGVDEPSDLHDDDAIAETRREPMLVPPLVEPPSRGHSGTRWHAMDNPMLAMMMGGGVGGMGGGMGAMDPDLMMAMLQSPQAMMAMVQASQQATEQAAMQPPQDAAARDESMAPEPPVKAPSMRVGEVHLNEDGVEAIFRRCPFHTLVALKLVGRSWRKCARGALHARLGTPPAPPPPPPPPIELVADLLEFAVDGGGPPPDERAPIVIDVGGAYTKVGFAGSDEPSHTFPTVVARPNRKTGPDGEKLSQHAGVDWSSSAAVLAAQGHVGQGALDKAVWRQGMGGSSGALHGSSLDLVRPVDRGVVTDWDALLAVYEHAFLELRASAASRALMVVEPPLTPRAQREALCDLLFDKLGVAALSLTTSCGLALFATGRPTGVVVDVGDGLARVVPVVEGYTLSHHAQRLDVSGRRLTEWLGELASLASLAAQKEDKDTEGTDVELFSSLLHEGMGERQHWRKGESALEGLPPLPQTLVDVKEARSKVAGSSEGFDQMPRARQLHCACAEALFRPSLLLDRHYPPDPSNPPPAPPPIRPVMDAMAPAVKVDLPPEGRRGLHEMIGGAVEACPDATLRPQLYANIVLTGGSVAGAAFGRGVEARLTHELDQILRTSCFFQVANRNNPSGAWQGGSIAACMPEWTNLGYWVTRADWERDGAKNVLRRSMY